MNTNESSPFALDGLIQLVRASIHFFPLFLCFAFFSSTLSLCAAAVASAALGCFSPFSQNADDRFHFLKDKKSKKNKVHVSAVCVLLMKCRY